MTATARELNTYIKKLTEEEKNSLALALKKQLLKAEAQRLSSFKVRKSISMQEVINEVRLVRKKNNAA
ncbi:MAG: hypothetical protein ABIO55_11235 [Ginsengibacter sp.]